MTRVRDLFHLEYGHSLELNTLQHSVAQDAINFVGRAARNNGVTARVNLIPGVQPAPGGTLTVALGGQGGAGMAFLQPKPYYCGRDVMILRPKAAMLEQELLWWATCISANRFRFGFGRQANRTLKDLKLPASSTRPAWVSDVAFDDGFKDILAQLRGMSAPMPNGDVKDHIAAARCPVTDLFDVQYGTNLELLRLSKTPEGVNYVSRTAKNNGVAARVVPLSDVAPIAGGVLSVAAGGSVLETFVQFEPFYTGRDMYVLRPKGKMSAEELMFYAACLRANQWRYSYGQQANRTLRSLTVPSQTAVPSWIYGAFKRTCDQLLKAL